MLGGATRRGGLGGTNGKIDAEMGWVVVERGSQDVI